MPDKPSRVQGRAGLANAGINSSIDAPHGAFLPGKPHQSLTFPVFRYESDLLATSLADAAGIADVIPSP